MYLYIYIYCTYVHMHIYKHFLYIYIYVYIRIPNVYTYIHIYIYIYKSTPAISHPSCHGKAKLKQLLAPDRCQLLLSCSGQVTAPQLRTRTLQCTSIKDIMASSSCYLRT